MEELVRDAEAESRHQETRRRLLEFLSDPEVRARFEAAYEADQHFDYQSLTGERLVPDESIRQRTRELREVCLRRGIVRGER